MPERRAFRGVSLMELSQLAAGLAKFLVALLSAAASGGQCPVVVAFAGDEILDDGAELALKGLPGGAAGAGFLFEIVIGLLDAGLEARFFGLAFADARPICSADGLAFLFGEEAPLLVETSQLAGGVHGIQPTAHNE